MPFVRLVVPTTVFPCVRRAFATHRTAFARPSRVGLPSPPSLYRAAAATPAADVAAGFWLNYRGYATTGSDATYRTAAATDALPFKTYRYLPRDGNVEEKRSAVIVLQEWWGVTEQIKLHAQRIADGAKALTVIPDIYKGKLGMSADEASHLMASFDWKQVLRELEVLVDTLKEESYSHIASVGFCMGGMLSIALASRLASKSPLAAAITCYGVPPPTLCDISVVAVKTPVQGHFGNEDKFIGFSDPNAANSLERQLEEGVDLRDDGRGQPIEIYRYDGEGHAFLNDEEWARQRRRELGFAGGERKEVQDLAWRRMFEFLQTHLK